MTVNDCRVKVLKKVSHVALISLLCVYEYVRHGQPLRPVGTPAERLPMPLRERSSSKRKRVISSQRAWDVKTTNPAQMCVEDERIIVVVERTHPTIARRLMGLINRTNIAVDERSLVQLTTIKRKEI
jgi:hypothetical protein